MSDPLPPRDGGPAGPAGGLSGGRGQVGPGGGGLAAALALTVATGSMDAIAFLALGEVFTSVMTANLSLLGMAAGTRDPALAGHAAVAVVGYVLGSLVSGRIVRGPDKRRPACRALGGEVLALGVLWALWAAAGGHPDGGLRQGLLALAAVAMGGQSTLVRAVAPAGVSTTYFTGMLTGLLADLAATGRVRGSRVALLSALVTGAVGGGLLLTLAPRTAPALPTGLVAAVWLGSLVGEACEDRRAESQG
ncbi:MULTISPECIES: YoaK family protein [unclassified Streptomyces]|uniref:YoaK family protein n=1 Tax=unclassified Streptomyces TaxID=2593676 RepID=UPI00336AE45B